MVSPEMKKITEIALLPYIEVKKISRREYDEIIRAITAYNNLCQENSEIDELIGTKATAKIFGCSPPTAVKIAEKYGVSIFRPGGYLKFSKREVLVARDMARQHKT